MEKIHKFLTSELIGLKEISFCWRKENPQKPLDRRKRGFKSSACGGNKKNSQHPNQELNPGDPNSTLLTELLWLTTYAIH
jgi:hypothetical protein